GARTRYRVHDGGGDRSGEVLGGYLPFPLLPPGPVKVSGFDLYHGWHAQGDGKWFYGLSVENGRVKDVEGMRLRSGLRAIVGRFRPGLRLTPMQDILLCDLEEGDNLELERMLGDYGI